MEPGSHFQEAADASIKIDLSGCRLRDARQDLEESRFSRSIAADDANYLALVHVERDILEGPENRLVPGRLSERMPEFTDNGIAKRFVAFTLKDPVLLPEFGGLLSQGA